LMSPPTKILLAMCSIYILSLHADVSAETYREAVRSGQGIAFVCRDCKVGTPSPNVSFDVANVSFNNVDDEAEDNVEEQCDDGVESSLPSDDEHDSDTDITYTLVSGGSSRGRDKLVDSDG